jgi:hypothetical protein
MALGLTVTAIVLVVSIVVAVVGYAIDRSAEP